MQLDITPYRVLKKDKSNTNRHVYPHGYTMVAWIDDPDDDFIAHTYDAPDAACVAGVVLEAAISSGGAAVEAPYRAPIGRDGMG